MFIFRAYIRYIKWLYTKYNKVGITAGNKVLVRSEDGSYRPAGVKGQIVGNVLVQGMLCGIAYYYYRVGKQVGQQEGFADGAHAYAEEMDRRAKPDHGSALDDQWR